MTEREKRRAAQRGREARLKPEFAHLYPALEPDRWESAGVIADRVVAWLLRQPGGGYVAPDRVLRAEHFDFQGGPGDETSRPDSHTRREDK